MQCEWKWSRWIKVGTLSGQNSVCSCLWPLLVHVWKKTAPFGQILVVLNICRIGVSKYIWTKFDVWLRRNLCGLPPLEKIVPYQFAILLSGPRGGRIIIWNFEYWVVKQKKNGWKWSRWNRSWANIWSLFDGPLVVHMWKEIAPHRSRNYMTDVRPCNFLDNELSKV